MMDMPEIIRERIENRPYQADTIGLSGSAVWLFDDMVLKIEPASAMTARQRGILTLLDGRLPAPRMLAAVEEEGTSWLLMTRLTGEMACAPRAMRRPRETIAALAAGIHLLRRVEITDCPYVTTIDERLSEAEALLRAGTIDRADWIGDFPTPEKQLDWLVAHRFADEFVFSHGDYCLPNVLLQDGQVAGFIDLAQAGMADKWYDVALCVQSMRRNFSGFFGGDGYAGYDEAHFFSSLGETPDSDKIRFHLLLDALLDCS